MRRRGKQIVGRENCALWQNFDTCHESTHRRVSHAYSRRSIVIRVLLYSLIFFVCTALSVFGSQHVIAVGDHQDAVNDLSDEVERQLGDMDFSQYDSMIGDLENDLGYFEGGFFAKVVQALQGGLDGSQNLFGALAKLLLNDLLKFLPMVAIVAAIAVLSTLLQGLNARQESSKIIYYACFCGILLAISVAVVAVITKSAAAITQMQNQMNVTFPILLTLMSAIGSVSSVAVYQPMVSLLAQGVSSLMTYVVLPAFVISYILTVVSSMGSEVKLNRLSELFASAGKWLIGIVFTVFSAFLSIQGIYAGLHDGVSFRTAKYAISHYVPIVGGYLSDGLNMILAGSMLIKNAVGVVSAMLLIVTVLSPLLSVICLKFALMLLGAALEPLQNNGFASFCSKLSKSMNLLIAILVSVAFMYFISLVLMICSANYVVGV